MTALIVIFITLSLMGSALWIMPPKKERQRMALRMQARQLGLTVQLTSIDLPDKWDKSINHQKTIAYSVYRSKPVQTLPESVWLLSYEVWKYHLIADAWWASYDISLSDEAKRMLEQYRDVIIGIKITPESVSFYWGEAGDERVLKDLAHLIFGLAELKSVK